MFGKKGNTEASTVETKKMDSAEFKAEMKEHCTVGKLASVAGIAVAGYVLEVGLKILTGTLTD